MQHFDHRTTGDTRDTGDIGQNNATIGKIMNFRAPPFQPPPGSHFSVMANIITSNGATTKLGITTPVIATPFTA